MKTTQDEKTGTKGKLFQRQESTPKPPMERPAADEQQAQDTGTVAPAEETAAAGLPVAVETGGGGKVLVYSENFIDELCPHQRNLELVGDGAASFESIKIQQDFQRYFVKREEESYAKLNGLVVAVGFPKAFWYPKDHKDNPNRGTEMKFPFCHSHDGKKPVHDLVSEYGCGENICKYDGYGSIKMIKPDDTGNGKACKNMIAFVLFPLGFAKKATDNIPPPTKEDILKIFRGETDIYKVIGSPTSIKGGTHYISYTLGQKHKVHIALAVTEFSLNRVEKPHVYSVMELSYVGHIKDIVNDIARNEKGGVEMFQKYLKNIEDTQKYLNKHIVYDRDDVDSVEEPF